MNLVRIGERYIAMTETPLPIEFDPETLDDRRAAALRRQGRRDRSPPPTRTTTRARRARELLGPLRAQERVPALGPPGRLEPRRLIAKLPVREPAYMHAFGMSERYLILAEYPLW